jgi:hypothetical protein
MHASIVEIAEKGDALAISDALEALIAEGKDTPTDREYALKAIIAKPENTAAYAFARGAVAGRVAESRGGMGALNLVGEVARWGELSRKLDPNFREGAATRMLATLYTKAPPALLPEGRDSETGLDWLDQLIKAHPKTLENHLRKAEALVFQGDAANAVADICLCLARKGELRRDDQLLLEHIYADAGNPRCPAVTAPAPAQKP